MPAQEPGIFTYFASAVLVGFGSFWWLKNKKLLSAAKPPHLQSVDQPQEASPGVPVMHTPPADTTLFQLSETVQLLNKRLQIVEARLASQQMAPTYAVPASAVPGNMLPALLDLPRTPEQARALRIEVYRLADEGISAGVIAQQLRVSRGEIDLLLNLR